MPSRSSATSGVRPSPGTPEVTAATRVAAHFERLDELRGRGLLFFPIRHHSPACAWHLRRLIFAVRPSAVLIEGPRDFDPLIPLLLHSATVPPVAVYTTWADRRRAGKGKRRRDAEPALPPARFAGYYPLCDYSPELVALRAGNRVGARLRFIDLTFPEQVVARQATFGEELAPRVLSLLEEGHLFASSYTTELGRRLGCRDGDELWDHLFEYHFGSGEGEAGKLQREVGAYTFLARLGYDEEGLEADGTLARERAMAAAIRGELEGRSAEPGEVGPILVVCGGFHTGGLASLLSEEAVAPGPLPIGEDPGSIVLTRYSFPQLDALNGYSSGMPAPYYYQRLWELLEEGAGDPGIGAARDLLVETARRSRQRDLAFPLSAADAIAAVEQTRRLAWLRRHSTPCRQDLLDGATSCFVKGERDGAAILDLVRDVLTGSAVGRVPREAGLPPLVADFRRRCERLGLDLGRAERKRRALDIYRKRRHREMSRFFHGLRFLGSTFAVFVGGPDFRRGTDLDLMQEHWEVGWSPNAEVALIEAALYGATVEEATRAKLRETIAALEREGRGRSAAAPVELLVSACRMGLHRHLDGLLELIEETALEDPSFPSLVAALDQLVLLWQSREPLEAHDLTGVPRLAGVCYRRACFLLPQLGAAGEEETTAILDALSSLREHLALSEDSFDQELFFDGARRLALGVDPSAAAAVNRGAIAGGAAGVLFAGGRLAAPTLLRLFSGHLKAALSPTSPAARKERRTGFLRGLMVTGREALWRLPGLLETLDDVFGGWSEEEFLSALPELRLSFSTLTPRETDRLARLVGSLHGEADVGDLARPPLDEAGLHTNSRITAAVLEALRRDGLEGFAG